MTSFRRALGFLTILPVRVPPSRPGDWRGAALWFPTVGLVLGALIAGSFWCLSHLFSPALTAVLTIGGWALLTGGLHLDGLADCGDGLAAAASPEKRLEIMRDPRLGTFGAVSLLIFLLTKVLATASLLPSAMALRALLLAPVLARWLVLWVARLPAARKEGLGASFGVEVTLPVICGAAPIPLVLVVLGGWHGLAAAGLAGLTVWAISRLAHSRLGGITGDVLGLTIEMAELMTLVVFAVHWT